MDQSDNLRLINVCTVSCKSSSGNQQIFVMFDLCSSDNWVSESTVAKLAHNDRPQEDDIT